MRTPSQGLLPDRFDSIGATRFTDAYLLGQLAGVVWQVRSRSVW
jgi:hypothetical protein